MLSLHFEACCSIASWYWLCAVSCTSPCKSAVTVVFMLNRSSAQVLFFIPAIRKAMLSITPDPEKEFSLSCEMSLLFRMLYTARGNVCQASNLFRSPAAHTLDLEPPAWSPGHCAMMTLDNMLANLLLIYCSLLLVYSNLLLLYSSVATLACLLLTCLGVCLHTSSSALDFAANLCYNL